MNRFRSRYTFLLSVLLVAILASSASADGWMPKLWNSSSSSKPTHKKSTKTPLKRITDGTKEAISDTGNFLMPWRKNTKKANDPYSGAGQFFRPDLAHQKKKESSWWPGWFSGEEEEVNKPLSVPEWMAQERPGFDNR